MMSVYCPRHGHEVLLGHRQILGIEGQGPDIAVRFECWCGHRGAHHPQGRRPTATANVAA